MWQIIKKKGCIIMNTYEELKLEIFESAHTGEITESEKYELLETLDNVFESTAYNRYAENERIKYNKKVDENAKKIEALKALYDKTTSESVKKSIKEKIEKMEKENAELADKFNKNAAKFMRIINSGRQTLADTSEGLGHKSCIDTGKQTKDLVRSRNNMTPAKKREAGSYLDAYKALKDK